MEMSDLPKLAASLGGSMAQWAAGGFQLATPENLASRLEACRLCEFWDADGFGHTGRCLRCGCSTQAKLRMATSSCPVGKW
jgi:hypothetical protein